MNENAKCFAKGVGTGIVMGSTIGMMMSSVENKKGGGSKKNMVSKAFKTMGDIVENIGDSIGM